MSMGQKLKLMIKIKFIEIIMSGNTNRVIITQTNDKIAQFDQTKHILHKLWLLGSVGSSHENLL